MYIIASRGYDHAHDLDDDDGGEGVGVSNDDDNRDEMRHRDENGHEASAL